MIISGKGKAIAGNIPSEYAASGGGGVGGRMAGFTPPPPNIGFTPPPPNIAQSPELPLPLPKQYAYEDGSLQTEGQLTPAATMIQESHVTEGKLDTIR